MAILTVPKADEPPLHRAARVGDHDAVRALVRGGADIESLYDIRLDPSACPFPATPLMVAAGSSYGATLETVHLLIELGADPRRKEGRYSATRFAARGLGWHYQPGGDPARLAFLLERGGDVDEVDGAGRTLLADAVGNARDPAVARLLLARGAHPDPAWSSGHPRFDSAIERYSFTIPLFEAAARPEPELVEELLKAGATPKIEDKNRETALFSVFTERAAKVLVSAGVDTEHRNWLEWTALDRAASEGNVQKIRALLAAGANPNATHDHGFTVFMSAAAGMDRSVEALRALVHGGADPHAVSEYGWTAAHAAVDVNGAEANSEANIRAVFGYLKELGLDFRAKTKRGETVMDLARSTGTEIVVRVLKELRA